MNLSNAIRGASMVLLLATACILAPAALAKTTDESDLWWVPTESGWGIQIVQQDDTIFATMFVYGPDGQPTWYSATLFYQGTSTFTWSGDLYKTTGPWFGPVPLAVSSYDFRARTRLNSRTGCTLKGFMDGLWQPPPAQ